MLAFPDPVRLSALLSSNGMTHKVNKNLDSPCVTALSQLYSATLSNESSTPMFDDLFDFAKKRTLKQSIGFFIFHGGIAFAVVSLLEYMS